MILSCQNLKKAFGTVSVIREASFHIEDREKAALVGPNGAGKSTLLKMITGELSPDEGLTVLSKGKVLGYLAQHQELDTDATIYEEVRKVRAYLLEWEQKIRAMASKIFVRFRTCRLSSPLYTTCPSVKFGAARALPR